MNNKQKVKLIKPSFLEQIKWGIYSLLLMYISTSIPWNIISFICLIGSIYCLFVSILETIMLSTKQSTIDEIQKQMFNQEGDKENKE